MSRRNSSVLWTYFQKVECADGEKNAMCLNCGQIYSYKSSTGNLKAHLKKRHPSDYVEVCGAQETYARQSSQAVNGQIHYTDADGDEKIVEMIDEEVLEQNSEDSLQNEPDNDVSLSSPRRERRVWNSQLQNRFKKLKYPLLQVSSRGSILDQIENGKLQVIAIQKEIAELELRMKEEEERQTHLKYEYEDRQREREEKIKEIELQIKQHQLKQIESEN